MLRLASRPSITPRSPNWRSKSTRAVVPSRSRAIAAARFRASIDFPIPPLPLKTSTIWPLPRRSPSVLGPSPPVSAGAMTGTVSGARFNFSSWLTRRSAAASSSPLKGLTRNSLAPAWVARRT